MIRCDVCERRCPLGPDTTGYCRMYHAPRGQVEERFPDRWCAYATARMETIPFYHAWPGARCLVVGTAGCNFDCRYCANAEVVKVDPAGQQDVMLDVSPEDLVAVARKRGCRAIVFSVNEPTVSLPTLERVAAVAKTAGLVMGCLTNGYATPEGTARLGAIFDCVNVSLKGLSPEFCRDYLGVPDVGPILRNIEALARTTHVEVTTPVIEGVNSHELAEMADFLAGVGPDVAWHAFRLLPEYKMRQEDYPSVAAVGAQVEAAARGKLRYVYFHNFIGSRWVNTLCPGCGEAVIERHSLGCGGDRLQAVHLDGGACPRCGAAVALRGDPDTATAKEACS